MTGGYDQNSASLFEMAVRAYGRAHLDDARVLLDALLEVSPGNTNAWFLLAEVHQHCGRENAAAGCLRRVIADEPGISEAYRRLSQLMLGMGRYAEAAEAAERACRTDPADTSLNHLLGVALARCGKPDEALGCFTSVIAADAENARAAYEAAMIHLGRGDFEAGWPLFERRHSLDPNHCPPVGPAPWTGENVNGERLLVTPEGGFGDMIWAARFLPEAAARGARIVVMVPAELEALFANLEGVDRVIAETDEAAADAELWCPFLSLPARLGVNDPASFPPARLHRQPMPEGRLGRLLRRAGGRRRVGIIWSGSVTYGNNRHRAATLADFLPLAELPHIQLYSLQKGLPQAELSESGIGNLVIDADDYDFAETAALVESLDLIIMTDSAVGHIAGSLGKPVWMMLDTYPFWYHKAGTDRSAWYGSMRYFRQKQPGDWRGVVDEIAESLMSKGLGDEIPVQDA